MTTHPLLAVLASSWVTGWWVRGLAWAEGVVSHGFPASKLAWVASLGQPLPAAVSPPLTQRQLWTARLVTGLGVLLLVSLVVGTTGQIGLLCWTTFALVAVASWLKWLPPMQRGWTLPGVLVLLFFGSFAVSAAFSSYRPDNWVGLGKTLTFLAGFLTFHRVLAAYPPALPCWLATLFLLGVGQSALGYTQFISRVDPLATWSDPTINPDLALQRVYGTIQPYNPNLLAGFLVPAWAAGLWSTLQLLLHANRRRLWPFTLLSAAGWLLITLGIVWTGSRGAYLGLGAMGLASFMLFAAVVWLDPQARQIRWLKPLWLGVGLAAVLGCVGAVAAKPQLAHRLASIFAFREDSSISYRMNVYASSWRLFLDNWLVGAGPGNGVFKKAYGLYMTPGFNALGTYSVPLAIAVEQGLLGLGLAALAMVSVLTDRLLWLTAYKLPLTQRTTLFSVLVGLVGFFVHGLFDTILYRPPVQLPFWLMLSGLLCMLPPVWTSLPTAKEG